jgi:hypothetical protein
LRNHDEINESPPHPTDCLCIDIGVYLLLERECPDALRGTSEGTGKIVEDRMNSIQQAETQYLRTHGYYTASLDSLVKEGLLADSLRFIPFSDDVMFSIQASMEPSESGETVPQMSCSASYRDYLNGMNEKEIDNLIRRASEEGKFPGLIIGNVNP